MDFRMDWEGSLETTRGVGLIGQKNDIDFRRMEKLLPASRFLMIFDNVSRNVVEKDKPREISINPFQIQAYAAVFVSYLLNFELITKLGKWMTFPQDRTLTLTQNKALTMMIDESSDDSATSSLTQLYQRDNESVPKFHRRVAKVVKVFKC